MVNLIQANLDLCRVGEDEAEVVISDATEFLRRCLKRKSDPWVLVFFDPPYADDYLRVLQLFGANAKELLDENGLMIVEHLHQNKLPEVVGDLRLRRVLKQGDSSLSFYGKSLGL
jgi:16S rRNA G966 N2-methylase RsmD